MTSDDGNRGAARPSLVMLSGLPGTGKTTLATRLAGDVGWPLEAIDDLTVDLPADTDWSDTGVWDELIVKLLRRVLRRLVEGESVIVDSVFMDLDRWHARAIAVETRARFRPVHTYVSDEAIWRDRVNARREEFGPGVATWDQIQRQRLGYRPWMPGTALFLDTVNRVDDTYAVLWRFVTGGAFELDPLGERSFEVGRYHSYVASAERPY